MNTETQEPEPANLQFLELTEGHGAAPAGTLTTPTPEDADEFGDFEDFAHSPELFAIDCEDHANWLLRKVAALDAEKARVKAQYETIAARCDKNRASLLARFGPQLEAWAREELARKGGRVKSLPLIQGTVAFRTVPLSLKVVDAADALTTAKAVLPAAVRTVEELDRREFLAYAKDWLEQTGETLPGVERTAAHESMSLRFPNAKGGD